MTAADGRACASSCRRASTIRRGRAAATCSTARAGRAARRSAGTCGCRRSTPDAAGDADAVSRACPTAALVLVDGLVAGALARRGRGRAPSACASWCSRTWSSAAFPDADPRAIEGERRALRARAPRHRDERMDAGRARRARASSPPDRVVVATPGLGRCARGDAGRRTGGVAPVRRGRRSAQGTGHPDRGAGRARHRAGRGPARSPARSTPVPTSRSASRRARPTPGSAERVTMTGVLDRRRARRAPTSAPTCWSRRRAPRATAWPSRTRCGAASRSSPAASAASRRPWRSAAQPSWCHRVSPRRSAMRCGGGSSIPLCASGLTARRGAAGRASRGGATPRRIARTLAGVR